MPPYYFLLSYFTLLFTIDQDVFYSNSISHTLRQILYRLLYILHPLARQFHPGLALFLHAASVFIACLFICKTQSMSANRIKMHLYRYFQFTQCVKNNREFSTGTQSSVTVCHRNVGGVSLDTWNSRDCSFRLSRSL